MLVVCDLDFTLADATDRLKLAGKMPNRSNRPAFQAWLDRLQTDEALLNDKANRYLKWVLRGLAQFPTAFNIVYLTSRGERYREVTVKWLKANKFPEGPLMMRKTNDWRTAKGHKEQAITRLKSIYGTGGLVFDDDSEGDCSQMYIKHGFVHLEVKGVSNGTR